MKKFISLLYALMFFIAAFSQDIAVYPTHWWIGMKDPNLQLMIHLPESMVNSVAQRIAPANGKLADGMTLKNIHFVENPHYIFLDVTIDKNTKPGVRKIKLSRPGYSISVNYELKAKPSGNGTVFAQGVTASDFIYLIMPDRFSNGDVSNDSYPDMRDQLHDRNNPFDRHGGDIQGITNHLDYLKELGVSTLWLTPVIENDMARTSEGGNSRSTYHGYAFTDQYKIDKRFGGDTAYKRMVNAAHAKGMKIIQDAVYNHVGNDHFFIRDMPMKDWVNQWPSYINTSYKDLTLSDPYASAIDAKITVDGWFTPFLPDLNQRNPYVSTFLIQYAIWSTQEYGIDGWRVDTYFYNDPAFLNKINDALLKEFPRLTIFGEVSANTINGSAYFAQNNFSNFSFKHNLQGITDFPLFYAMQDGLNQRFGWTEGVNKVYMTLAQDNAYKDPNRNCIFLDNHDQDRIYSVVGEDFNKYKMGINWLLTLRGIPQLYYGTEILMKNRRDPSDAEVRKDFPGGWPGDAINKFNKAGRTDSEQMAFNYVSKLANYRKNSSALTKGKLMQFVPEHGVYVYFRYDDKTTIMVISNTGERAMKMDWAHYIERTKNYTNAKNVITGENVSLTNFQIHPKESFVFELIK